jgi:hypothetical protein
MVNYLLTVEDSKLVFKKGSAKGDILEPDYLPYDPKITNITLPQIKLDQEYINFLDCIKDGTNENTLLRLDLFLKQGLQYGFAQSLATYESNILIHRRPFLEPHSWSNLKQDKIKGKRSNVKKTTYDESFEMENVVWDCGLSPACFTRNSTTKNKLPLLRATFGSFIDPLCKINSSDFGPALSYPPLDKAKSPGAVSVEMNKLAMSYFGFGGSSINNVVPKSGGQWDFNIDIKIGKGCTGKGCKITQKDSKYLKGNNIKSVILKSKTTPSEKVKYIILKEFGDKIQVLCFLMMFIELMKSLMNTCDMVVYALCLFLKIPCVFSGNHHQIDALYGSSDYKKYRIIKYSAKKESELETYQNLYDKTKNSVLENNENKIDFIKIIKDKLEKNSTSQSKYSINDGNKDYYPPPIVFGIILIEFQSINGNLQNYLSLKEQEVASKQTDAEKIIIYREVINSIKPLYEIVSIFRAKSDINNLKLIQTLQKFTVKGNTTKPYFKLWLEDDATKNQKRFDTSQFRALTGKSSIGEIIRACSPAAAGGGKAMKGGAFTEGEQSEGKIDVILSQINMDPPDERDYNKIITWAVLWIEDEVEIDKNEESVEVNNQIVYIDNDQYWQDKGLPSIQYQTADYQGINIFLTDKSSESNQLGLISSAGVPLSIVSSPISYYFYNQNPKFVNTDTMDKILNDEIIKFLKNEHTQQFISQNIEVEIPSYNTNLGDLATTYYQNPSDLNNANILLYSIQETAYKIATEHAKGIWEGSQPWEWRDEMANTPEADEDYEDFENRKEEELMDHEKAKEIEISNAINSLGLPNFEPTEFFDTTTEYSLERTVINGINLYLDQATLPQSIGDGLSAEPQAVANYGLGAEEPEEKEDLPAEEEAMEYANKIYNEVYNTLHLALVFEHDHANEEADRAKNTAYTEYLLGRLLSVNYDDEGNPIYNYKQRGGSNKEGDNKKISNEEAYALYLIYSGSDNSNVMSGIPLVNSPEEYHKNNELFFKYMSEIITNTSVSDSDHINPLFNFKKEVKAEKESKNELAGEINTSSEPVETNKNIEKTNLDTLISLPQSPSVETPGEAAGGKKRKIKKRTTKKRRKKKKKTISKRKHVNKKTKHKKRKKKKSIKN